MDSKRRREPPEMAAAGAAAYARLSELAPDIVVVCDDNAARLLVEPCLIGGTMPVVFAGINWTIEEYRLPAPNVTGMVEVAPLRKLLETGSVSSTKITWKCETVPKEASVAAVFATTASACSHMKFRAVAVLDSLFGACRRPFASR